MSKQNNIFIRNIFQSFEGYIIVNVHLFVMWYGWYTQDELMKGAINSLAKGTVVQGRVHRLGHEQML